MTTASFAGVPAGAPPRHLPPRRGGDRESQDSHEIRGAAPRSAEIDRALALLRRAIAECGYTVDELEASMRRSRAHIYRVLHGQTPMSLRFFFALPVDVEARFEQLRLEHFGIVIAQPSEDERRRRGSGPRRPGVWSKGDRLTLRRYLVTWTDGVTRVIHARRLTSARELAAQLEVPDGVFVRTVKPLR